MPREVLLLIDGAWAAGAAGRTQPFLNPANGEAIGTHAVAEISDLDRALAAADRAFRSWSRTSAFERYKLMRAAAETLRSQVAEISRLLTEEQGKPLAEARIEVAAGADLIDWFAEEGRRTYGRIVPARAGNVQQSVVKEPVGPVAAFSPWNFPINQAVRKISAALAAGCSIILKGPEETPASCAALCAAFQSAGLPAGALNLVFGVPAMISEYLIAHPVIRKLSFTGSTAVGKQLASLAGRHMKRVTMELGGHAPVLVFEDADIDQAVKVLVTSKFRNAGQVCASPTRFLVQEHVHDIFVDKFVAAAQAIKVGDGAREGVVMGPLANVRRVHALESLVTDAVEQGARLETGGRRIGSRGYFFEPTVLTQVPTDARVMNEEPFGPVVPIVAFGSFDEAVAEANRLQYGLGAFAFTRCSKTAAAAAAAIEAGMVSINHAGFALPETHFGGVKDSGYGSEGGSDALEAYLSTKFITHATI